MGVTIDQIQVEIQSSSNNAAQGITDLSTALKELKKSGTIGTATKNLQKLSDSLRGFSSAYQASNSLRSLANSMEKLKSVGSVASIVNSLTKLPAALKALESINIARVAPQIQEIASAVVPLSFIKGGGLGTMVNAMSKLGKVTESLDDDTISAFTKKVELLNEKLGPLSEKMASISSGFKAINTNAKNAASGIKELDHGVNTTTLNLSNFIDVAKNVATVLQSMVQGFSKFVGEAIEWDGIAARFGRGFGAQAQETYDWIQRLNKEMGINIQQFMQYSSIYATMLTGFGVANEDATKMALGYTELTYDIWAGYNDVYTSFAEASEAVKSAIAGEVEPIRRAGFTIIESTLEQTAANHGLEISLANATEAQKSYLRYLTLVDQAHSQNLVGTYAKELNTAEGLMRTFSQQLKSLTQAFGSLFLPILVKVMPYLQAFVELLTEGVHWLAAFLGIEIQKVDFSGFEAGSGAIDQVANSAGGASDALNSATKAAKELKNATLGIDELNVISPPSSSSSAGGGAGGGAGGAGSGGNGFADLGIGSLWDETIFDSIQSDVDSIKQKMKEWLPVIAAVAGAMAGVRLIGLINDLDKIKDLKFISFLTDGAKGITEYFKAAKQLAPEVGWLAALFPKLSTALAGVGTAIAGISAPVWIAIAAAVVAVGSAIYFIVKNFDELKQAVKDFFAENISPKFAEIGKHFDKIKEALGPLWTNVLQPFGAWLKSIDWGGIFGKIAEGIGMFVVALPTTGLMGIINGISSMLEGLVQSISGVIVAFRGFIDLIVGILTGDGEKIKEAWRKIWQGTLDIFKGLYDMTIGMVVEFVEGIIDWFVELWDVLVGHSIVPDTINAIVKWFTSLPSKIFGSVQSFVTGIIDKFKNLGSGLTEKFTSAWNSVKTWWSKKPGLSSYTPSIGSIYDKLKERWDNARTWWNSKKTKANEYTPSIGSIYEKLSARWKNARDWWNKSKGSMSYTPSIGSIVDKVKSAWNSAKSWWSKNAKLSSLTTKLNVSVPTIKVKWETASAFGKSFKYPTGFSLKFAANGGIFDQGSMIWAGERGAEIVANAAGGKTGVMNVQQMQDAVYEGVFAAMSAAMRGRSESGSQEVRVYLDGREITASVKKHQHESGASIMGNEVYSF